MIYRSELKKFLLLFSILFAITVNTKILKILKEALVVTAPESGAEVIPYLKTWVAIPFSLLLIALFHRLSKRYAREHVFYLMTSGFVIFLAAFYWLLYPNRDLIHPHAFCDWLETVVPPGLHGMVQILRYWSFSIFYVAGDMWASILLSLIFWNFLGAVVEMAQAKRFYALFSLDLAGVGVGILCWIAPSGIDDWDGVFRYYLCAVMVMGVVQMILMRIYHRSFPVGEEPPPPRPVMSWKQKLTYLRRSPELLLIVIMVCSFEFTDNILDVLWKGQLVQLCQDPEDYSRYLSRIAFITGLFGVITVFFISRQVLGECRWRVPALLTPTLALMISAVFFTCLLVPSVAARSASWMGLHPLQLIVAVGALQSLVLQISKYTFFDNSKELAFRLQSDQERPRAKAIADAFATRVGKSGASLTQQCVFLVAVNLQASAPVLAILVFTVLLAWWGATWWVGGIVDRKMDKRFELQAAC